MITAASTDGALTLFIEQVGIEEDGRFSCSVYPMFGRPLQDHFQVVFLFSC